MFIDVLAAKKQEIKVHSSINLFHKINCIKVGILLFDNVNRSPLTVILMPHQIVLDILGPPKMFSILLGRVHYCHA